MSDHENEDWYQGEYDGHPPPSTVVKVPADFPFHPGQLFILPPTPEEEMARAAKRLGQIAESLHESMSALRDASQALLESVRKLEGSRDASSRDAPAPIMHGLAGFRSIPEHEFDVDCEYLKAGHCYHCCDLCDRHEHECIGCGTPLDHNAMETEIDEGQVSKRPHAPCT